MLRKFTVLLFIFLCFCVKSFAQDSSLEITLVDRNNDSISDFSAKLKNEKGEAIKNAVSEKSQTVIFSGISDGPRYSMR